MLLAIRHVITLEYAAPVCTAIQYLRLRPRHDGGQRVRRWQLAVAGRLNPWQDCHGNAVDTLVIDAPTARIEVVAEGEVDTATVPRPADAGISSGVYLRSGDLTACDDALREFARDHASAGPDALAAAVRGAIRLRSPVAAIPATAAEAFASGLGSSSELAHVFIACCRHAGVPARFVSGYVAEHSGAAAHAWAEALTSDGWVGYDPSRGARAGLGHVALAIGLDHGDAGSAVGPHRTGGSELVTIAQRVGQIQQ
jgi:transglutaminase-like putative cysteine protease